MAAPENKIDDLDTAWDEGKLGQDEASVRPSTPERDREIEDAAELQMISVRLQKELIEQLKFIADFHGIGYQPLMRDVLCRWARSEMLQIAKQMKEQIEARELIEAEAARKAAARKRA